MSMSPSPGWNPDALRAVLGHVTPDEMLRASQLGSTGAPGTLSTMLGTNLGASIAPPVATGARASGLAGLISRVPGTSVNAAGSGLMQQLGFAGPARLGGSGAMGVGRMAGRALPWALAGDLASKGINTLPGNQDVKDVFGNAAAGAGLGAAAGSIFPGVGTGAGALIGGALGAGKGLVESFMGGDDNQSDVKGALAQSANDLGLNGSQYSKLYDLLVKSGADKNEVGQQLAQQMMQDAQVKQQQSQVLSAQNTQRRSDQQFALAIQSQAAKFFAPYTNNIVNAGITQSQALRSMASRMPPEFQSVFENQAQMALGDSQRIAGAYAAQANLMPMIYNQSQGAQSAAELAKLQYQQAVIDSQQGGGQGQGFDELVAQLGQQQG